MDIHEQLRLLQTAEGDPARLALATVDLAFPTLAEGERTELKTALEAASIPHWCDAHILAALLEIPVQTSRERLARLRRLKVIEPFPARGEHAVNVHEAARLALRRWLAAQRPESFRAWSQRAAEHFAADPAPAARIEWIYHRLGYDPERAATELECLDSDWTGSARPEDYQALAIALRELLEADVLDGRARVWAMLCVAWARHARGETAQLGDQARAILDLAAETRDQTAIAEAQCLGGDVLQAQGKLSEAQAAFGEYLAICRRLAEQDPSNAAWQRDLAVGCWRVASLLKASGRSQDALPLYEEAAQIFVDLVERCPDFAAWSRERDAVQRELALCRTNIRRTP